MEAMATLSELVRLYAGTQAAKDGGPFLSTLAAKPEVKAQVRAQRARELLAQVRDDYRKEQYLCCLDRCELLAASYADLPEGVEGMKLATELKNNPEWLQKACATMTERLNGLHLALAESWLSKGQPQQAVFYLERVIQTSPDSREAAAARLRLAAIQGRPTWQTEFKK